jgi:hypothetical protein
MRHANKTEPWHTGDPSQIRHRATAASGCCHAARIDAPMLCRPVPPAHLKSARGARR